MTPRCVITGCTLIFGYQQQHGDLWELGSTWIFNACGEPAQREDSPTTRKAIMVREDFHESYFERRNVYVFLKCDAVLSLSAAEYIARGSR